MEMLAKATGMHLPRLGVVRSGERGKGVAALQAAGWGCVLTQGEALGCGMPPRWGGFGVPWHLITRFVVRSRMTDDRYHRGRGRWLI